jgi:predicted acyl esterase
MGISLTSSRLPQDTKVTGPVGRRFGSREVVRVEVEIWSTSMVFKKGHGICLDIQPRDGVGSLHYAHYHADYNTGTNTIQQAGPDLLTTLARSIRIRRAG